MAIQFNSFRATKPVVRLIDADNSIYEVFFIVYDPAGEKHYKRFKRGINTLPKNDREKEARAMVDVLWDELQKGWNPLLSKYPEKKKEEQPLSKMTFDAALDYALKAKIPHLSKYSVPDYRGTVRFMQEAARSCDLLYKEVRFIERKDIRLLIATAKEDNEWSANARNKYLSLLQALLTMLVDDELIKFNPAHKIKNEPQGPLFFPFIKDTARVSHSSTSSSTVLPSRSPRWVAIRSSRAACCLAPASINVF